MKIFCSRMNLSITLQNKNFKIKFKKKDLLAANCRCAFCSWSPERPASFSSHRSICIEKNLLQNYLYFSLVSPSVYSNQKTWPQQRGPSSSRKPGWCSEIRLHSPGKMPAALHVLGRTPSTCSLIRSFHYNSTYSIKKIIHFEEKKLDRYKKCSWIIQFTHWN